MQRRSSEPHAGRYGSPSPLGGYPPPPAVLMIHSTEFLTELRDTEENETDGKDGHNEGADSDRRESLQDRLVHPAIRPLGLRSLKPTGHEQHDQHNDEDAAKTKASSPVGRSAVEPATEGSENEQDQDDGDEGHAWRPSVQQALSTLAARRTKARCFVRRYPGITA